MGKNHRHLKKLKSERGKTKLKSTKAKFLPKGQNVTDTNFKIKPIVIREQLVRHGDHVTSKQLNFKDIVNRLNHHNTTVKVDNLQQLREFIVTIDEELLQGHVLEILEAVCPLYSDDERKVRKEAVKLTNDLLALISEEGIEAHFDRIVSYLCCCMTRLSEGVQEDSLLIFDVLLVQTPNLLAKHCDRVIKNFILLISKVKVNANDRSMLQTNVKNKRTSVQWRLEVLLRFKQFLKAIVNWKLNREKEIKSVETIEVTSTITISPIYFNYYDNPIDIYGKDATVDSWLDVCIEDILPLLKDIWIEVQPKNKCTVKSAELYCTVLNEETANTLNCIVTLLGYFHELTLVKSKEHKDHIENKKFINNSKQIITLLFESFPYSREIKKGSDTKCLEENLTLSYLFFVFFERVYQKDIIIQTLSYLNVCLLNRNYVSQENSHFLLKTLKQFYTKNLVRWAKYRTTDLSQFIRNTARYYIHDTKQVDSIEIFNFLCEQTDLLSDDIFFPVVQKACRSLIGTKIELTVYKTIRMLLLRGIKAIRNVLSGLLPQILDTIRMIDFEGIQNERFKINTVLNLYKYVPLTPENIESLLEFSAEHLDFQEIVQEVIDSWRLSNHIC